MRERAKKRGGLLPLSASVSPCCARSNKATTGGSFGHLPSAGKLSRLTVEVRRSVLILFEKYVLRRKHAVNVKKSLGLMEIIEKRGIGISAVDAIAKEKFSLR